MTHALLAQATRSIEVHAFLPSELDAPHHRLVDAYRDKLSDFTSASNDRMVVRIYDPTDPDLNESERQDVQSRAELGMKPLQLSTTDGDRRVQRSVWLGATILYGKRQVVVPNVQDA